MFFQLSFLVIDASKIWVFLVSSAFICNIFNVRFFLAAPIVPHQSAEDERAV